MNWRWLILDYIDPKLGLTREQRSQVMSRVMTTRGVQWKITALALAILMLILPGLFLLAIFLEDSLIPAGSVWLRITVRGLAFVVAFPLAWIVAVRLPTKRALRDSLHAFGFELCAKCGYQLRGLDDYERKCPECGTEREPIGCYHCGYPLYMIRSKKLICPECGSDQRTVRDPSRWWWLNLRQVAPAFDQLPDAAKSAMRRQAFNKSAGRVLIIPGLIVTVTLLTALLWYKLVAPMMPPSPLFRPPPSALELAAYMLMVLAVAMIPLLVWVLLAVAVHRTYGSALRKAMRDNGYDVCRKCGCSLVGIDAAVKECPECGSSRRPLPADIGCDPTLPTTEEFALLTELHSQVGWQVQAHIRRRALLIVLPLLLGILVVLCILQMKQLSTEWWITAMCVPFVASLVTSVWIARLRVTTLRRCVREELRKRGREVCMDCGAWLRGLGDDVVECPMCHASREPMKARPPDTDHASDACTL